MLGGAARGAPTEGGLTMQRWEYLFVEVSEHRDRTGTTLSVGSSIDRYKRGDIRNPVPGDIPSFMDELGADGWEMINCRSDLNPGRFFPIRSLEAVFKRPKLED